MGDYRHICAIKEALPLSCRSSAAWGRVWYPALLRRLGRGCGGVMRLLWEWPTSRLTSRYGKATCPGMSPFFVMGLSGAAGQ